MRAPCLGLWGELEVEFGIWDSGGDYSVLGVPVGLGGCGVRCAASADGGGERRKV